MNIIGNNCIASHIYYDCGMRFNGPFSWCGIDLKEFVCLADSWGELDLADVSFSLETRLYQTRESVVCSVGDGKVKVHFSHYLQDDSFVVPGKCDRYRYCMLGKDVIGYARERWFSRLGRTDEEPVFLYCCNNLDMSHPKTRKEYPEILRQLFTIRRPLVVVVHESIDIPLEVPKNVSVIWVPDKFMTSCTQELVDTLILHFGLEKKNGSDG